MKIEIKYTGCVTRTASVFTFFILFESILNSYSDHMKARLIGQCSLAFPIETAIQCSKRKVRTTTNARSNSSTQRPLKISRSESLNSEKTGETAAQSERVIAWPTFLGFYVIYSVEDTWAQYFWCHTKQLDLVTALCFSAHTNNYFYFYMMFLLLTFCINVLHRLIVNGCVLSPMFKNKRRYNTIQYNNARSRLLTPSFQMTFETSSISTLCDHLPDQYEEASPYKGRLTTIISLTVLHNMLILVYVVLKGLRL